MVASSACSTTLEVLKERKNISEIEGKEGRGKPPNFHRF